MTDADEGNAEGLTLGEAIERYSDPAAWEAWRRAAKDVPARPPPIRASIMTSPSRSQVTMDYPAYRALKSKRDRLWHEVLELFIAKLRSGELVATGYVVPLEPQAAPIEITPALWSILGPDFKYSTASGGELKLIRVLVRPARDREASETVIEDPPPVRRPGRPSLMPELRDELIRRAEAGELEETQAAQCRALAAWVRKEYLGWSYSHGTLREQLGPLYNELKDRKK